ncbi:MAG: hypothetical protein M1823_000592 [Watsoniomyces obsoletus]|nr:MAG: hypothetical protein M1823_000592 [Watsoniomyces obsoletus]
MVDAQTDQSPTTSKTYVVEHLDPEIGPWSTLEYVCIADELQRAGARCLLSSFVHKLEAPEELKQAPNLVIATLSAETMWMDQKDRVCLLDPAAAEELSPADGDKFDVFLFGGILDRTAQLRNRGFVGRRLGPKQMTTDTAVRVTRMVVQDKIPLDQIPYVDNPELRLDEHETTEMPFRYVLGPDQQPVMPKGMIDLIKKDADKGIEDLF